MRKAILLLASIALYPLGAAAQSSCEALASLPLADTVVTEAHEVPAGSFTPPGSGTLTNLPAFCRVALTVAPAVRIEVWLPTQTWNERYQGVGGGGYAGVISYAALARRCARATPPRAPTPGTRRRSAAPSRSTPTARSTTG
jgi:feruloyl esterase